MAYQKLDLITITFFEFQKSFRNVQFSQYKQAILFKSKEMVETEKWPQAYKLIHPKCMHMTSKDASISISKLK